MLSCCTETQNCARVDVFGIIFVVKIEQKQVIWCLKRKSLNCPLVFLNCCKKSICNHADFWIFFKNGTLCVIFIYYMKLYKSILFLPLYLQFCDHSKCILTD